MNYSKLSDFEINKRVAVALNIDMHFYIPESEDSFGPGFLPSELGPIWQTSAYRVGDFNVSNGNRFNPCNNPADAWPIIVENGIGVIPYKKGLSEAWNTAAGLIGGTTKDKNPLRAAMVVFLMMQESANVQDNPA